MLHVMPPNGPEDVKETKADQQGYSVGYELSASGTWTFFARWAGDANRQPADSPSCTVDIN